MKNIDINIEKGNIIINIFSFDEYNSLLSFLNKDNYYYRGQSNTSWKLKSSFLRCYEENLDNGKPIPEETDMIVKYFNENNDNTGKFYDVKLIDIIAKMQHHGHNTRLLDFTECPNIALYFSIMDKLVCQEKADRIRSSIYLIKKYLVLKSLPPLFLKKITDNKKLNEVIFELKEFSQLSKGNAPLFLYKPNHGSIENNIRLKNQKGLFIFSNNQFEDLDKLVKIEELWNRLRKIKIIKPIPVDLELIKSKAGFIKIVFTLTEKEFKRILNLLNKMNINKSKLFQDNIVA